MTISLCVHAALIMCVTPDVVGSDYLSGGLNTSRSKAFSTGFTLFKQIHAHVESMLFLAPRITIVEMGSNDGAWMNKTMTRIKKQGKEARCFMFEPQEQFVADLGAAKQVAMQHRCILFPTVVWVSEQIFEFHTHPNSEASSLMPGGRFYDHTSDTLTVKSIDVVQFFLLHMSPFDWNFLKLDVEGAEYIILERLITTGLACWLDKALIEFHALHHERNYNKRPMDVVFPYMMKQCGVDVQARAHYPDTFFDDANATCKHCSMLSVPSDQ
jgi:FkbM family methyltransferase